MTSRDELPDHMNEAVFQRNRLPPRAYHLPEHTHLLSGRWDFHHEPSAADLDLETEASIVWSSIVVPGHWQLQGWDFPRYTNFNYPFPCRPPLVPTQNPTGHYRKSFHLPPAWHASTDRLDYRLRFEGVDSAFHLWLNGQSVGYSQGSRNAAEFDISPFINIDPSLPNILRVKVYQWSDGSYIEDQDMWWLSGIFRDVYLIAFPKVGRIEDFFVRTNFEKSMHDAILTIDLEYVIQKELVLTSHLTDATGGLRSMKDTSILNANKMSHSVKVKVASPKLWSAEQPFLYNLDIVLSDENGILQTISQKVGFRKVVIEKGSLHVNDTRIMIRGVNRHDHHPRLGRAVPIDFIRKDLMLMKQHNINALRTSHYPNDPRLVQLANEIGLYVMDEADLECHGTGIDADSVMSDKESWKPAYVERMKQLVHRDKNNPCIILWSLGNESFYGQNHQAMYDWCKDFDPTRPVHYENDHRFYASDIASYMYTGVGDLAKLATEDGDEYEKPVLLQEYAHSMGNGPGGLSEYMDTFRKYRRLQGGFIWEWANHGLAKVQQSDKDKSFYAYGGDFAGDDPNDGNFVMDGLCDSEHRPTPGLRALKAVYAPLEIIRVGDKICIKNLHDFQTLEHLQFVLETKIFNPSGDTDVLDVSKFTCSDEKASTGPGTKTFLDPFPRGRKFGSSPGTETWVCVTAELCEKTLWAEEKHVVAAAQFRFDEGDCTIDIPQLSAIDKMDFTTNEETVTARSSECSLVLSSLSGEVLQYTYKGVDMFEGRGPRLTFWRASTDNDRGGQAGEWRGHRLNKLVTSVRSIHHRKTDTGAIEIKIVSYIAPAIFAWGFKTETTYTIGGNGSLLVAISAVPVGQAPDTVPRVGLEMDMSQKHKFAEWFGLGPGQTYKDMKQAGEIGIWKRTVDEMAHMYEMPQESGNHTETRWVKIRNEQGVGLKATLSTGDHETMARAGSPLENWAIVDDSLDIVSKPTGFDFAYLKYSAIELDEAQHPHELRSSKCNILRVDLDHHGLGSASCGPDVLDQYRLQTKKFEFTVGLEPLGV